MELPVNIFFNGPPGVGKTSVAEYLAKQSQAGAVIDVDQIRHFQKGGLCRDPHDLKFVEQKRIAYENTKCLINNFRSQGLETFAADLVLNHEIIKVYEAELGGLENSFHFVLLPDIAIAKERNKSRSPWSIMEDHVIDRYYDFVKENVLLPDWTVINTSNQTVEETAKLVLEKINSRGLKV